MKTKLLILIISSIFVKYSYSQSITTLDVIAKKEASGKIVGSYSKIKNTIIDLPLSELVESLEIVKLDGSDQALVSEDLTLVSDNYILVKGIQNNPYKLFDKKGKFIASIGGIGQGPGEYKNTYDAQIDEKNKKIYILPWKSNKLLVYDFTGKAVGSYPLHGYLAKGVFKVEDNNTITLATVPVKGWTQYFVWSQTISGEVVQGIDIEKYDIEPSISNEIFSKKMHPSKFDFSFLLFDKPDHHVYNYDFKTNKLDVVFEMNFESHKPPIAIYGELPLYFLARFSELKQVSEDMSVTDNHRNLIIDKKTMKGGYYQLKNDFLGYTMEWASFINGYYTSNHDPSSLRDIIDTALKENTNIDKNVKDKISKLRNSITDNDNNYIIYGKLKTE